MSKDAENSIKTPHNSDFLQFGKIGLDKSFSLNALDP